MSTSAASSLALSDTAEPTESCTIGRVHDMPFGATVQFDGSVVFRVFAPDVDTLQLAIEGKEGLLEFNACGEGWKEIHTAEAGAGSLYQLVLPGGRRVPDPASRFQPRDIDGPSEVIAPGAYVWRDGEWKGRAWVETVLYELHVGTFTPEGTFLAAIEKLEHLQSLGITMVEVMPLADFPGRWNWGYDGALWFAPDSSYGRPEDFKTFVEAAHAHGISVILDVVYNHFGPSGNYIPEYFHKLFTGRHKTDWGDAVNYDNGESEHVREFVVHNALYWIEEFHLDGLRLDAVHAIMDESPHHILDEIAERVRQAVADRPVHLLLENENNEACRLRRDENGQPIHYTAQWNDDVHHVLHTAATKEDHSYYKDFQGDTRLLGRALAEGFAFQGETMESTGKPRGENCPDVPMTAFVAFIQNHDQIGNRALGERLRSLVDSRVKRALVATYLLLPQIPLLFMGEEWNAAEPFPYFCDFQGELAEQVREGRREEFSEFPGFADGSQRTKIPDPQNEETFRSAKPDWSKAEAAEGQAWIGYYRELLRVRREQIVPLLSETNSRRGRFEVLGQNAVQVRWDIDEDRQLECVVNLKNEPLDRDVAFEGEELWFEGEHRQDGKAGAWTVRWAIVRCKT